MTSPDTRSTPSTGAEAVDSPNMRRAGADLLSLALIDARNHSLALVGQLGDDAAWWTAGHIAWFAEHWIGRNPRRGEGFACPSDGIRLASIEPNADALWSPEFARATARLALSLPPPDAVRAYMLDTLESTLELLEKAGGDPAALYFFRLALFHEDLRSEQLITHAQTAGMALPLDAPAAMRSGEALLQGATHWQQGSLADASFCPDNELSAHEVAVPEFEIDANPVSWQQYLEFVDDGGYDQAQFWHPQGWQWLQEISATGEGRRGPRHVEQISMASGAVLQTRFGKATRMAGNQPAMHLSWWEADAWCRWAGRRLPLELEWEIAAHKAARMGFAWGQVWEWCANSLYAYPGFVAGPWAAYSQPHFGSARVLRGASFATRQRMKHPRFRGFASPAWDAGFVGFRSCAL